MTRDQNVGFQEQRKKRLEWLAEYMLQVFPSEGIKYGEVRSKRLSKWGLTAPKTDEYIQIVIEGYGFELPEGRIVKLPESADVTK